MANNLTNLDGLRNILNLANDLDNESQHEDGSESESVPNEKFNINYNPPILPVSDKIVATEPEISNSADSEVSGSDEEEDEEDEEEEEEEEEGSTEESVSASVSVSVVGTPRGRSRTRSRSRRRSKPMTMEEIMFEKQKILMEFTKLEKRGVTFTKKFTINSDLNEMKFELMKSKKIYQLEKDLKIARNLLWNGTKAFTFGTKLLSTYTPIDLELEGWSDEIKENIYDYDDVLEKLIEKYKSKIDAPPEIQLGYMLLSSAMQYSAANKVPRMFAKMMNVRDQSYDPSKSYEQNINNMDAMADGSMPGPEDDPEMAELMREINAEKEKYT